jgi:hypothetical protein
MEFPNCVGIVMVHQDNSMTCTHDPCSAADIERPSGSDTWLLSHSNIYGCEAVLGDRCPRCTLPTDPIHLAP